MTAEAPGDVALIVFLRESLMIEGIHREPTADEIRATDRFMESFSMSVVALNALQAVYAPDKPIRDCAGMNVRVANYIAPPGGASLIKAYGKLVTKVNGGMGPWDAHVAFEKLHPYLDGNGRTGRALWAWIMRGHGFNPFAISFLHRFYYQTLAAS